MSRRLISALGGTLLGLSLFSVGASAQTPVAPFPMSPLGSDDAHLGLLMQPKLNEIAALPRTGDLLMVDALLPDGSLVDLDLTALDIAKRRFGFQVNGVAQPRLLDGLDLTLWRGTIRGAADTSEVMLSFSNHGCSGWIRTANDLIHLVPDRDGNDWQGSRVLLTTEAALNARGAVLPEFCNAQPTPSGGFGVGDIGQTGGGSTYAAGSCNQMECTIAMETDYQLFQVFGNLSAMTTYVTTLLTYVSDRYESQASTVLTFPYLQFYTTSSDPWSAQDGGGGCIDVLYEFQAAWVGNIPGGATLGHMMSGANLGCGVAWLDVLCNSQYNFSVSGNINGGSAFPIQQQPNNWDFMVVAHELGHNFGSPHTHDYCPPLDECAPSGYFGQCQSSQVCTSSGTIMSYCHLCSGGTGNITTYFHPTAAAVMLNRAQTCLPNFSGGITADPPTLLDPGVATPVTIDVATTPVGGLVELYYRYGGNTYTAIPMTSGGGNTWNASLPAASCGDSPEFYFTYTDAACGQVFHPAGAPGTVHSADVGTPTVVFADDFETNTGWVAVNLGASSGDWQRGVPVDDSGWDYDIDADYDGSGSCYLTQNQTGNTDVDDGAVELTSPSFDMSGGSGMISYAYFLRLTNDDGADMLLVEASSTGSAGPWTEVARHDTNLGLNWSTHAISSADLAAASVSQTADMMIRFTTNDSNPQSIVEAGVDAFDVSLIDCGGGIGTNYCTAGPNAVAISAQGSDSVAANNFTLHAETAPTQSFGLFFYGASELNAPLGQGTLCVGGVTRLNPPLNSGNSGHFDRQVDFTAPPSPPYQILPGQTWNFQIWFRDGGNSDLSDALKVTFQP
ncbi:MAG TPA: M12 family metallo-peptidase [Planctomycetota bacterium]|nr:M12 family metallo-peptidase [Planctomycetota bacterium]